MNIKNIDEMEMVYLNMTIHMSSYLPRKNPKKENKENFFINFFWEMNEKKIVISDKFIACFLTKFDSNTKMHLFFSQQKKEEFWLSISNKFTKIDWAFLFASQDLSLDFVLKYKHKTQKRFIDYNSFLFERKKYSLC